MAWLAYPKLISNRLWMTASFENRSTWPEERSTVVYQPSLLGDGWPIFELAGFLVDGRSRAVLHSGV